jgi:hypothetical protein
LQKQSYNFCHVSFSSKERSPVDEGMTNGPSIFAYLVFGPGRISTEGMTRPMKVTAWRGPVARLIVQDEDSKEEA